MNVWTKRRIFLKCSSRKSKKRVHLVRSCCALYLPDMGWATFWAIFDIKHLGSMLWSQFSAIFANFQAFFFKKQCCDWIFEKNSSTLSKKRQYFC
jgi:hypothetical protein